MEHLAGYHARRKAATWSAFRARVEELGGTVLEPQYLGTNRPHRVRCAAGHEAAPRPGNVLKGQGICRPCGGRDPETAWSAFRARVEELGGTVLEQSWKGSGVPHRVRCAAGHEAAPWPLSVARGQGICPACVNKTWDVLYVVQNPATAVVKFGITSGDPTPRLRAHSGNGFVNVHRCVRLEGAAGIERLMKANLRALGVDPVQGREYFPDGVMDLVLSWVDEAVSQRPEVRE